MDPQILREAMLAYEAVHNPELRQALEEKQEFENWVNSLVEEGYDLSEYTWEEMYNLYEDEIGRGAGRFAQQIGSRLRGGLSQAASTVGNLARGYVNTSGAYMQGLAGTRGGTGPISSTYNAIGRATTAIPRAIYRGAEGFARGLVGAPAASRPAPTTQPPARTFQNTGGYGRYAPPSTQVSPAAGTPRPTPSGSPAPAPAAAAAGPRPAPAAGPRPAPAAGTPRPAPSAPTNPTAERRTPTSAELRAAQQARRDSLAAGKSKPEAETSAVQAGISRSLPTTGPTTTPEQQKQLNTTGYVPLSSPPAAKPTPAAPTPAASRSTALSQQQIRNRRLNMDYNPFDIVLGHLLDEGYADTEEAALVIMTNMSEDWRDEIVEAMTSYERNRQRAAQRAAARNEARKQGKTGNVPGVGYVSPRKERETWTDERGQERHTSGARMPKNQKEAFNIFVNTMISEGISLDRYSWNEIENVFDDLFEAQRARENPEGYERGEGRRDRGNQSREQQLRGKVMNRMSQMDPERRKKMLAQMRAAGLDV